MTDAMTKPNGWTDSWLSDVMRDDALDASYHRREIDADRGVSARADSDKAREVVASLYEALAEASELIYRLGYQNGTVAVKARAALSAVEGGA